MKRGQTIQLGNHKEREDPHLMPYSRIFFRAQIFPETHVPKVCPGASCNFASYSGRSAFHNYIMILQIYNLFAFLWLINFVIALGQCTLAGAFASYYWAMRKPEDIPKYPLFVAFGRAVR